MTFYSADADLVVVGAGAAGLTTAIFAARAAPGLRVRCLDGARRLGAKILVSGGSRCNLTNTLVTERDFWGGQPRIVRHVLRAFPAARAVAFFEELGVDCREEEDGKLFPSSGRSRTVLDALLAEAARLKIELQVEQRVRDVRREPDGFALFTDAGDSVAARAIVLATGGRSLPKSGSDGHGYELARALGHRQVETTPALAPLLLDGDRHQGLSGVSHPAALMLYVAGARRLRLTGALLWTHFGLSGPVALNLSRHWHRAALEGVRPQVAVSVCPEHTFASLEALLLAAEAARPKALLTTMLAEQLPSAVARAWVAAAGVSLETTLAHLTRDDRRRVVHGLIETPLEVCDSRGYNFAEVTAGGVPLDEIAPASMESRVCPGLYLVGEILDVDGRLGGFNFQWAWSSAWVAGQAIARALAVSPPAERSPASP
jgi:predicted Rossmann fold flavoprotein